MNVNLNELIAALPEDIASEMKDISQLPVPVSALHRLWMSGELSAQVALGCFALWVRRYFEDAETGQRDLMETNLRLALKMFHRLSYMRGAMTKLGQQVGNLPHVVPAQFADTLEQLHFDVPPMHYSLVREVFEAELGRSPDDLFASFERQAFAAASLGQVHRARLTSGEEVAVKIQYPGVARTIDADFRNLRALLFPMRLTRDWDAMQYAFDEIHRMLTQEVDYVQEADSLRKAGALYRLSDGIVIPRVHSEYSTRRVLTMDLVHGRHLPEFLASNPSQEVRDHFGTKMYEAWKRLYDAGMNHADPSSGNYLFLEDGRLGMIDFGCVQHYSDDEIEIIEISHKLLHSMDTFDDFLKRAADASDADLANPEYVRLMRDATNWMMLPALTEGPFDFGSESHMKDGVEAFAALIRKRYTRSRPMWVYFQRTVVGLRALLYRMRARVDVRGIITAEPRPTIHRKS
jgi:predicted unusual protein kinase regulating ubiquinone biosynthesis (AarF/ABC1/UbiB family)